jgi:hypothetical protein
MDLKEMWCEDVYWNHLGDDSDKRWVLVNKELVLCNSKTNKTTSISSYQLGVIQTIAFQIRGKKNSLLILHTILASTRELSTIQNRSIVLYTSTDSSPFLSPLHKYRTKKGAKKGTVFSDGQCCKSLQSCFTNKHCAYIQGFRKCISLRLRK